MQKSKCLDSPLMAITRSLLKPILCAIVASILLAPQIIHGSELSPAQKEYLKKLDGPILLRGDYFKAIAAAYEDFSKRLERDAFKSRVLTGEEASHSQWLSHIENYDIDVEQSDTMFLVSFAPTVRGDAPIVLGGVVKYHVDRKTFQITDKTAIK